MDTEAHFITVVSVMKSERITFTLAKGNEFMSTIKVKFNEVKCPFFFTRHSETKITQFGLLLVDDVQTNEFVG